MYISHFLLYCFILSFPCSVGTLSSCIPFCQFLLQRCLSVSLIIGFYNFIFHNFRCVCMCNVFMVFVCPCVRRYMCTCVHVFGGQRLMWFCLSLPYTLRQVFHLNLKLTVTANFASELDLDILCLCLLNNSTTRHLCWCQEPEPLVLMLGQYDG